MAGSSIRAGWTAGLVLAVVALALAGCGGGSASSPTATATGEASSGSATAEPKPLPGHPKIAAKSKREPPAPSGGAHPYGSFTRASAAAAERRADRRRRAAHRKLARKAGKATSFLVPEGDNSIPTYGSEAPASVRSEAESALSRYLQAREAEDWASACSLVSSQVEKQIELLSGQSGEPDCAKAYAALAKQGSAAERADPLAGAVTSLRIERPHAFALFYGPGKQQYMMPMQEEGGAWKVTQIAPVPWPIGT